MSNYKLTSPIDVKNVGNTSIINLFATNSSNAVQIKSPSLTSNIDFILPTSLGTNGQFLGAVGVGGTDWYSNAINHTAIPIQFLTKYRVPPDTRPVQVNNNTFTVVATINFRGTTIEGLVGNIYAIVGGAAAVGVQVRIFDRTNNRAIGTSTAVTTVAGVYQIVQIPMTTNPITAAASILEVQLARTTSGTAQLEFIQFLA